jgi:phosphoglycolate phosphatase-like HAD superfamily hydrolase
MVRLVLWDIDGTLIRTSGAGVRAFREVFRSEFNATDGFEKLKFAGRTDHGLVREFFGYHNLAASVENFERFFSRYPFWLDHILAQSQCEICRGAKPFLSDLAALPAPPLSGLLTGNIRLGAEIKLRHMGLWDRFEVGAFADDHEDRNQIAAIAKQRASRLLGRALADREVLVIGDTPLDIQCARSIGARVIAVATGTYALEELQPHSPDWAVSDLSQLTARDAVE